MKKLITVTIIFILSFKMNGQNLDNLYANAKLNIDYSSSILLSDKEIFLENALTEWILNNTSNFENINEIKIAFENKWYWGSWKKVVRGLEFVKKENTQSRIAYFEVLRKRNEAECRRQQDRSQMLWTLAGVGLGLTADYVNKHRVEIRDFFVDALRSSSTSDYSNSSNNNSTKESSKSDKKIEILENKKHIEFREDRTANCSQGKITYYKVYQNGKLYEGNSSIGVGDYNNYYYDGCANNTSNIVGLQNSTEKSKTTLKQFLIRQYESGTSNADSYTLTTK